MKKLVVTLLIVFAIASYFERNPGVLDATRADTTAIVSASDSVGRAYKNQQSDVQVRGEGVVIRTLPDDTQGSQHQKFILKLASGQTLLISHNIDLAPRINALRQGDRVEFYGEYEWNAKGGVVHWTHKDPRGRHVHGWLKHEGVTYQ